MGDIDAEKLLDAMTGSRDAAMALYRVTAAERDAASALADELAEALGEALEALRSDGQDYAAGQDALAKWEASRAK